MKIVTPQQMDAILTVTDSLSIHREAVVVPLGPEGQGHIRLANNKVEITAPDEGDFDTWLRGLRDAIGKLDLSHVKKSEE